MQLPTTTNVLVSTMFEFISFVHHSNVYFPVCSNRGMSDKDRVLFLNYHNAARLRVAKGYEPNKEGYMNPAKNMYKLVGN